MNDESRYTPTREPIELVLIPVHVVHLAYDAIRNDQRRHPYGHHQHWRDDALQYLAEADPSIRTNASSND
jgi:hypothetical protein